MAAIVEAGTRGGSARGDRKKSEDSSRYRLLVDQKAPFLYQLLHRARRALAPKPEKLEGTP
jgi:hypothetical protein